MKPCVLLISPGILKWTDMDFGLPHLVSMGGYLKAHTGVRVELLDLNYEGGDHNHLLRTIQSMGPLLMIGLSCYSSFDYMRVMALARFLRDAFPDTVLVTGGYHASALPDDVVFPGSPFDAVVVGEGEKPMLEIVQTLLGGNALSKEKYGPALIDTLDVLPFYDWSLLNRYWPQATTLGRKFQIYFSRGCPYHCTFCMERAKSGYRWRAHSAERAVEEMARLSKWTDLKHWVINIADPLFGFHRSWRRQVLTGLIERDLLPRQYWTLTRSDDLDDIDIDLLARARFSIGIGLESGSPTMLKRMEKGNKPERYLGAVQRLATLSQKRGLTWAVNVIVGHPGETRESMRETAEFVTALFSHGDHTRGWLSVDPFRLYPGSAIHMMRAHWERTTGAKFYTPEWWKSWYNHGFFAQHIDPSSSLDYPTRVKFMFDTYRPLMQSIQNRFVGQGRSVDRVYTSSIQGQLRALSPENRETMLQMGNRALQPGAVTAVRFPVGMNLKDPWVRHREQAVRRLLDQGVLRSADLIEALLRVPPERFMAPDEAKNVLDDQPNQPAAEGLLSPSLGIQTIAIGLEALEPEAGDVVVDFTAQSAYVTAILSVLVGPTGRVIALHPGPASTSGTFLEAVAKLDNVQAHCVDRLSLLQQGIQADRGWIGAALPRRPSVVIPHIRQKLVSFVGPRFRPQDLVAYSRQPDNTMKERVVARLLVPVLAGAGGWLKRPGLSNQADTQVRFVRRAAPALCLHLLSHLDLGKDAANIYNNALPAKNWTRDLTRAYQAASGRLMLQGHALAYDDVDDWLFDLQNTPPTPLKNSTGSRLIQATAAAVACERDAFFQSWSADEEAATVRRAEIGYSLGPSLSRLRERMWEQKGLPPALTIIDCPALTLCGRATTAGNARLVAVSLMQPLDHILCQVLHEEMHAITDPLVMVDHQSRDTHVDGTGFAIHQELERVAVAATHAFLEARAPELVGDFWRWADRIGIERQPAP